MQDREPRVVLLEPCGAKFIKDIRGEWVEI
jgi:hypothetical protein